MLIMFIETAKVRLEGGLDRFHGRVVIEYKDIDLTVCSAYFSMNEAKVICRLLGYK